MEQDKLSKLLNDLTLSKFAKGKWIELNALSGGQYFVNRNKRFKTLLLRSDLCDYNDKYIVVTWRITFEGTNNANKRNKNLPSRIMLHLVHAYQKLITHSLTMPKILMMLSRCITC